jgi:hypothetical protein
MKSLKNSVLSLSLIVAAMPAMAAETCVDLSGEYSWTMTPGPITADVTFIQNGCKALVVQTETDGAVSSDSATVIKADGIFRADSGSSRSAMTSSVFTADSLVMTTVLYLPGNSYPSPYPSSYPTSSPYSYPSAGPSYDPYGGYSYPYPGPSSSPSYSPTMSSSTYTITKSATGDLTMKTVTRNAIGKTISSTTDTFKKK